MAVITRSNGQGQAGNATQVDRPPSQSPPPPAGPERTTGRPRWYRRGWVIGLIALIVGIGLGAAAGGSNKTKTATVTTPGQKVVKTVPGATKTVTVRGATRTVTKTVTAPAPAAGSGNSGSANSGNIASGSNLPSSQQNAAATAKEYLSTQGFSRQGLIDQLSSSAGEGYPVADATAAVDSLNVDWNAQAVRSAKEYLQTQPFSCQGLTEQLSSSAGAQYTAAQAQYAAHQVGIC